MTQHIAQQIYKNLTVNEELYPLIQTPANDEDFNILIAECGIGKQAIQRGLLFPKTHITAFDISLRSLGYTKRKHKEYALNNVEFYTVIFWRLTKV